MRARFAESTRYRPAVFFAGVLLLALLSASCASTGVADLGPIFESPPEVVDITARSARVVAATKIDLVCAVAYGPTEEYGQLATDDDMAGAGHQDHGPMLTGLEPDTLYHLTFGGIGPDGTLYRFDHMTFRTEPEEAAAAPTGDNLALLSEGARVVGTSSNFGGADQGATWGGSKAIDGDPTTEWSTDGDGDDAWIEIELAAETLVTGVGFWTRTMGPSAQVRAFRVVSDRGDVVGPFEVGDAAAMHYFETDITARRLRFEVTESSGGNTGAVEVGVRGSPLS